MEYVYVVPDVAEAVQKALEVAAQLAASGENAVPLIYIGGSTYVVSEAVENNRWRK